MTLSFSRVFFRVGGMLSLFAVLTACAVLPRGAGLQREVLETRNTSVETPRDFAIAPVTRALLPTYAGWPAVGEDRLAWVNRTRQPANRIIAPGDTVAITIFATEDNGLLTAPGQRSVVLPEIRVSPAGSIFLPYVGALRISGMAPETARQRIEARYIDMAPSTQVMLTLAEGRQNSVSLVGGVAAPGNYPLDDQDVTVMAMVARGGGVAANLVNPRIRLQRGDRTYGTSVARLLADTALDTTLVGGDKIFVEADKRQFLSLGAAGSEAVHPFTGDRMTALEAMAAIGGVSDSRADPQGILILRRYPASAVRADGSGPTYPRVIFTIDLTSADGLFSAGEFPIRDGDLVYVTESPLTAAQTIAGVIGSAFGLARQAGVK